MRNDLSVTGAEVRFETLSVVFAGVCFLAGAVAAVFGTDPVTVGVGVVVMAANAVLGLSTLLDLSRRSL